MSDLLHQLQALCLAIWTAIAPGALHVKTAPRIALAIANAVYADGENAPATSSHAEDAALMAYFAIRESWLDPLAVGDGGKAHGVWQLHGMAGHAPLEAQARAWLRMLHEGARMCPEHPTAIMWGGCRGRDQLTGHDFAELAAKREERTRALLIAALGRP